MIFASVGTNGLAFDRFVIAIDKLARLTSEDVLIQIGNSNYKPKIAKYFDYCPRNKLLTYIKLSRVVIAQAGFGIIGDCIRQNKPLILIPRERKFGEAVDKQIELAEYLAKNVAGIICVTDVSQLPEVLNQVSKIHPQYRFKTKIPAMVKSYIDNKLI